MTLIMYGVKWIRERRAPRAEERFHVAHVLSVQSTAHFEDDRPVRVPGDPEHLSFPNDLAGIAAKVRRSPECMAIPTPPRTD